jgi:hypothetical protein
MLKYRVAALGSAIFERRYFEPSTGMVAHQPSLLLMPWRIREVMDLWKVEVGPWVVFRRASREAPGVLLWEGFW